VNLATTDAKERVRQAIDIVDLVSGYIDLRRQGRNFVGLCPWHEDTKPSFQVSPERQTFRCWVCDIGGDLFSFVMRREGLEFHEALEFLADKAGVQLESQRQTTNTGSNRKALFGAMKWAVEKYHRSLLDSPQAESAREYLAQRNISAESIARFRIGYAPNEFQWLSGRADPDGVTLASLLGAGLLAKNDKSQRPYDFYRGRVTFPISDLQHREVGIGGRILPEFAEGTGKYMNSRETPLFQKSKLLYALDLAQESARKQREIIVVEGYTDVVMCHQYGVENVVAVMGTAITSDHIKLLRRYVDRIVLVLDGDEAGQSKANQTLSLFLAEQVDLRVLTLPEGKDPCDVVQQLGGEGFAKMVATASDALEFALTVARGNADLKTDTHVASQVVERIIGMLALAPRLSTGSSSEKMLREQQMLGRLARETGVPESTLRQMLSEKRRGGNEMPSHFGRNSEDSAPQVQPLRLAELPSGERDLIEIFTQHPDLAPIALEQLGVDDFSPGLGRLLFAAFNDVFCEGLETDLPLVLAATENEQLKSVLVRIDDEAAQKEEHATLPVQTRLENILAGFRDRRESQGLQQRVGALRGQATDDDTESELLAELIAQAKRRQQIRE
jgi:DNA primase